MLPGVSDRPAVPQTGLPCSDPACPVEGLRGITNREGVGDDLDRRFQSLDPLLAIPGMRAFAGMAGKIAFDILFDGGGTIR